jgi:hypothetical protein
MPDWTDITEGQTDPGAPGTAELFKALRDNPIALAAGEPDAPRVAALALATGYIANVAVSGTTPVNVLSLGAVKRLRLTAGVDNASILDATLQIGFSDNGGSTWGSYQTLLTLEEVSGQGGFGTAVVEFDMQTGAFAAAGATRASTGVALINQTGTLTVPANADAVRFRFAGTGGSIGGFLEIVEGRV